MMHGPGGMSRIAEMEEENAQNRGAVIRRLISYLRPYG